jgi:hypothetical protein
VRQYGRLSKTTYLPTWAESFARCTAWRSL